MNDFFRAQKSLCTNASIIILVIVAALDSADNNLLSASFPVLQRTLGLDVQTLGYFSLFTNLSYALSMPFWGWMVHKYGMRRVPRLLSMACLSWGLATLGIAICGRSLSLQALFRSINGASLASILPLSQTLLAELVPAPMRGRAFGLMSLAEKLAGASASSSAVYFETWQNPYYVLGGLSIFMSAIVYHCLRFPRRKLVTGAIYKPVKHVQIVSSSTNSNSTTNLGPTRRTSAMEEVDTMSDEFVEEVAASYGGGDSKSTQLSMGQIVRRIVGLPPFLCLVAQGMFGAIPWDMMSFLLLLMDWKGFTKEQIVSIQFSIGFSSTVGVWVGGVVGDLCGKRWGKRGRVFATIFSVAGGLVFYGLFLLSPEYKWAILWMNGFHLVGTWARAAAIQPICAELTRSPSERAQIVSLWILLEKASASLFGAPLVGYITSNMLANIGENATPLEKASTLANNMLGLTTLFWSICLFFWMVLAFNVDSKGYDAVKDADSDVTVASDEESEEFLETKPFLSPEATKASVVSV